VEELASAHKRSGDITAALAGHLSSLKMFSSVGDPQGQAYAARNLGDLAAVCGEWTWAESLYSRSLSFHRQSGDISGSAQALASLALVALHRGRWIQASGFLMRGARARGVRYTAWFAGSRWALIRSLAGRWVPARLRHLVLGEARHGT